MFWKFLLPEVFDILNSAVIPPKLHRQNIFTNFLKTKYEFKKIQKKLAAFSICSASSFGKGLIMFLYFSSSADLNMLTNFSSRPGMLMMNKTELLISSWLSMG